MMTFLWPGDDWRILRMNLVHRLDAPRGLFLQGFSQSVLDPADGVLNFSGSFFIPALDLEFGVTGGFAYSFLHRAFGLLDRSLDAILVHGLTSILSALRRHSNVWRT
jgi:hypothetical protein